MSIQVPIETLADTLRRFGGAYLVTVGADRRAHIVSVAPVHGDGGLHLGEPGRTTRRNVEGNPVVSLVWPPLEPGGHSLIADGTAALRGDVLVAIVTRAVLHRPAAVEPAADTGGGADSEGECAADCVEIRL